MRSITVSAVSLAALIPLLLVLLSACGPDYHPAESVAGPNPQHGIIVVQDAGTDGGQR